MLWALESVTVEVAVLGAGGVPSSILDVKDEQDHEPPAYSSLSARMRPLLAVESASAL
jgi:hypothetical protein